ncbi:hypothetical protein AAG906_031703 [Vitis piasezkii]
MEEDVSRTKASHRKVKAQALALALAKESGIIIPKLDLYPLLFPLLRISAGIVEEDLQFWALRQDIGFGLVGFCI